MSVILVLLGFLLAAAGVATTGFGFLVNDLNRGATLILAGTFGFVGGLLLIGLGAVVAQLARVISGLRSLRATAPHPVGPAIELSAPLKTEAVVREPSFSVPPVQPPTEAPSQQPAPRGPPDISATAVERLRSTLPRSEGPVPPGEDVPLSPNGQHSAEPRPEPAPQAVALAEPREPRLDLLFRPRQARQPAQQEGVEGLWVRRAERDAQPEPRLDAGHAPGASSAAMVAPATSSRALNGKQPSPRADVHPAVEDQSQERTVAILKSGIVDGMAYTLYADGSIEAQLPQGTVRFGSIAELRAHIESNA